VPAIDAKPVDPIDMHCPLCGGKSEGLANLDGKAYHRCPTCALRFLDPGDRLSREQEYAHYLHHENEVSDPRYRRFLSKLADPLQERLAPQSKGLDFGCGPGPALALMLGEAGHEMAVYDPFFADNPMPLSASYDFVTCTETAEHFHDPAKEFLRLRGLVKPGGWLAIMTCFQADDDQFANWYYRKDPTHVVFYRAETFEFLAQDWGWQCEVPVKDVALLQRPSASDWTKG